MGTLKNYSRGPCFISQGLILQRYQPAILRRVKLVVRQMFHVQKLVKSI